MPVTAVLFDLDETLVVDESASPAIFALALATLEVEPSQAVMVGDTLARDILGAHRAGLKGIWINRSESQGDDGSVIPDATITSLRQVRAVLEG